MVANAMRSIVGQYATLEGLIASCTTFSASGMAILTKDCGERWFPCLHACPSLVEVHTDLCVDQV